MILAEPIQVTQLIAKVFDRLQIPYFVGGSLASSLHGIPRATQDVDMVAGLKPQHVVQKEKLDYSFLQRGARQMGVAALLEQAIKDAGETES